MLCSISNKKIIAPQATQIFNSVIPYLEKNKPKVFNSKKSVENLIFWKKYFMFISIDLLFDAQLLKSSQLFLVPNPAELLIIEMSMVHYSQQPKHEC
jgi:hypothetical protein